MNAIFHYGETAQVLRVNWFEFRNKRNLYYVRWHVTSENFRLKYLFSAYYSSESTLNHKFIIHGTMMILLAKFTLQ